MTSVELPLADAGWWWRPDSEQDRIPGRLQIDPKGRATLDLTIEAPADPFKSGRFDTEVIHGLTPPAICYSLLRCFEPVLFIDWRLSWQ